MYLQNGSVEFDELLVETTTLVAGKPIVLCKYRHEGPPLEFAEAPAEGPRPVLAFVTVYQHGVVPRVDEDVKGVVDGVLGDVGEGLFVALRREPHDDHGVVITEHLVVGRVFLRTEVADGFEPEDGKK